MTFRIIPRSEWGAGKPLGTPVKAARPTPRLWIHHTVTPSGPDEKSIMRQIQRTHQQTRDFNDIGYNLVFFPSGNIYEGCGWGIDGAHSGTKTRPDENRYSHGFSAAGNYQTAQPTQIMLEGIAWAIREGKRLGHLAQVTLPTGGHRDVPGAATACPGNNLYARLGDLRKLAGDVSTQGPISPLEDDMQFIRIPARDGRVFANLGACLVHVKSRDALERSIAGGMAAVIDVDVADPRAQLPIVDLTAAEPAPAGTHAHAEYAPSRHSHAGSVTVQ